ncbi:MAG TPA: selenocysteine-specific translation elongation factor [Myxococcota bacterium]|nr:selenocysteine-specific translation elongation factor [Myxococcota bacterium]
MPRDLILGTAGHIDHGKTTLVRALTGVDTDRLPEEKARGITIELGFAPLELAPGLRVGVIDVPGHEGLVRTMVSGATGIDLVLLVVAADEGVMPQTREHLAIVDLLGIEAGVVALTKSDLAEPDVADLAEAEVRELLAETSLAKAEVLRVSATSGAGVPELRAALARAAETAAARTPRAGPARLWIDRCFEMRGFGAVVTGTLIGSALAAGDAVELFPGGARARVRGLQSFGASAASVTPGTRCAVNLQGVALAELARGMLLAVPAALAPSARFDVSLRWLASEPLGGERPVACELLAGTAVQRAHVAPIGSAVLEPGARGFARIHLDDGALALLPGDRFIVRGFAAGATLGGGEVLDAAPPRWRRSAPELAAGLAVLASGSLAEGVALRIARGGFAGISRDALARQTGAERAPLAAAIEEVIARGAAIALGDRSLAAAEIVAEAERRVAAALAQFHRANPIKPGMPRETLRGVLPANAPLALFERALGTLAERGEIALEGELARAASFAPRLSAREEALAARLRESARAAGLTPRTLREWESELASDAEELHELLAHLERAGALVRAPGELWFDAEAVAALRAKLVAHLEMHGEIGTAAYKELIGATRKFAVPLMELFDSEHLTVRRGDARVLKRRPK